jgi:hypothetical protein
MLDFLEDYEGNINSFRTCNYNHVDDSFDWYVPGQHVELFIVVAGVDIFVVKTGSMFVNPKVRAWIPVADGSQAF